MQVKIGLVRTTAGTIRCEFSSDDPEGLTPFMEDLLLRLRAHDTAYTVGQAGRFITMPCGPDDHELNLFMGAVGSTGAQHGCDLKLEIQVV